MPAAAATTTYREALTEAMREALGNHDHTLVIGQGVTDHKGIFGTTLGLAQDFGAERLVEAPLAEEATTGICIGAALNGLYPIQTHIRADFALLAMNQLVNHAAKYRYMFGGRFQLPMLVRLVVGRSWGQGAQHSQSPQALFAHQPGLTVIMPASPAAVRESYAHAVAAYPNPVISLEHRLLYDLAFSEAAPEEKLADHPFAARRLRPGRDVTLVTTSIMALEGRRAAEHLAGQGIDVEVIDLHKVSNIEPEPILESIVRTGRLVVADTSWPAFGVAAEVCRLVLEADPGALKGPVLTLGMQPAPCPTAKALEDLYYPNLADLVEALARTVTGSAEHGIELPDKTSTTDAYRAFKGPF